MTITTISDSATQVLLASPFARNGLRLVLSRGQANASGSDREELAAVPCLVLKSAFVNKNIVNEGDLVELFRSLRQGERIEFCHSFHRDDNGNAPTGQPFRLRIRVAAAGTQLESLKATIELRRQRVSGVSLCRGGHSGHGSSPHRPVCTGGDDCD